LRLNSSATCAAARASSTLPLSPIATYVHAGCRRRARVIAEGRFLGRGRRQLAQLADHGVRIVGTKY
jgi:hypothetical protein